MHLLVIEDERALCETIVRSLRRLAYSVDCCYDGEKALELLGVERYDLVLLDLNLPGKDGLTVQLAVEEITRDLIARMGRSVKEAKGNTLLRLNVYDRQAQVSLNLFSKSYKVSLTQELVSFFEDNDIKYTVI